MKHILLSALFVVFSPLLVSSTFAGSGTIAAGNQNVSFGLGGSDGSFTVSGRYGKYLWDNIELGVGGYIANDDDTVFNIGPYLEGGYEVVENLTPYLGAGVDYYNFDGDSVFGTSTYAGVRYHFSPSTALFVSYEFRTADDDVFFEDGEADDTDDRFNYGIRYFF